MVAWTGDKSCEAAGGCCSSRSAEHRMRKRMQSQDEQQGTALSLCVIARTKSSAPKLRKQWLATC